MPTFNNRGDIVGGTGDNIVSIVLHGTTTPIVVNGPLQANGRPVVPAGGRVWMDDDTVVYQTYDALNRPIIQTYHVPTQKKTNVVETGVGVNFLIGGGGRWAAQAVTVTKGSSLEDGYGFLIDSQNAFTSHFAGVLASGRDGTFAIVSDYEQGVTTSLFAPDGRVTECPEETTFGIQVIGPTSAIWVPFGGGEFRTVNARIPKQASKALEPKVCRVGQEDWVVYYSFDFGLICHPFNSLEGYVLDPTGHSYWHDAIGLNGELRVTWSNRAGELPEDLTVFAVDLTRDRIDFGKGFVPIDASFRTFTQFASSGGVPVTNASSVLSAQLNLLEDDIAYRLALLATNVLQPLKNKYPNIVIKSGFRQVNTGMSQHELGEAVDLQITNQTPELLYEVANFIKNKLPFDQLILNFTNAGDKQPWLHVSFSPRSLRGQVLTKDYADTFYEGLFLVEPLTGEEAAEALREQSTRDATILSEMSKLQKRQERSGPTSRVSDEAPSSAPSTSSEPNGGGTGSGSNDPGGHVALVACVKSALGFTRQADQQTNINNAFEVTKRVAWLLRDEGCGLLIKNGGDNIVSWNGYSFSAGRVCFPDGQIFKILTAVEDGIHAPEWEDNGVVDQSLYVAALDPGSDFNMNWMQCALPKPEPTVPGNGGGGGGQQDPSNHDPRTR
jgi:hypothetical protein